MGEDTNPELTRDQTWDAAIAREEFYAAQSERNGFPVAAERTRKNADALRAMRAQEESRLGKRKRSNPPDE